VGSIGGASPAEQREPSTDIAVGSIAIEPRPRPLRRSALALDGARFATWTAIALFVAVACAVAVRTGVRLTTVGEPQAWGLQDFNDAVYQPGRALIEGVNPYDADAFPRAFPVRYPFPLYLPAMLAVHLPFAFVPFRLAGASYFVATLALVPCLALLALRSSGGRASAAASFGLGFLILVGRPGSWTLFIGQCTVPMVIATDLAFFCGRRRPGLGAVGVALAALKPTFGVPLTVLLLARGEWAMVARGLAAAGVVSLAVAAQICHATGGAVPFLHSLAANYAGFGELAEVNPAESAYRLDLVALIGRTLGRPLPPVLEIGLFVAVLGVAALGVRRLARDRDRLRAGRLAAALGSVAILLCTYHQAYDALLLTAPLVALAVGRWAPLRLTTPRRRAVLLSLLAIPVVNYLDTHAAMDFLGIRGLGVVANASVNGLALLAAFGVLAALTLRRS
jgi:hypothetical protein